MTQLTVTGKVDSKGDFGFYNLSELTYFLKEHTDKRIIVTFKVSDEDSRKTIIKYYRAKIIPEWRSRLLDQGTIVSEVEVDNYLKSISPLTEKRSVSELNRDELVAFVDTLKDVSLEDVNLFIEDARNI